MTTSEPRLPNRPPRRRRWLWVLGGLLVVVGGLILALPALLGTEPARRLILARADAMLAPGKLEVASFQFSWFGGTHMSQFDLRDADGESALSAPTVDWDCGLWNLLFLRPRFGTLAFPGGQLNLIRAEDGTVNLMETIRPLLKADPRLELKVRITQGSLRLRSPELARPILAERMETTLHLPLGLAPAVCDVAMGTGPEGPDASTMSLHAEVSRRLDEGDLTLDLNAHDWPLALAQAGFAATFRLSGQASLAQQAGAQTMSGRLDLAQCDATSDRLRGDHVRLDRAALAFDLSQEEAVWTIRKLEAHSDLAQLEGSGIYPPSSDSRTTLTGTLDLPAVLRQLPHLVPLREGFALDGGTARLRAEALPDGDRQAFEVEAVVEDLSARQGAKVVTLHDPATLSARLLRSSETTEVQRLALRTPFLDLDAQGDLDRGLSISGKLDLAGLQRQVADLVDFGAIELTGAGPITGAYRRSGSEYEASLKTDLTAFRLAGTPLGTLDEPELSLIAGAKGPADSSGLPTSWTEANVALQAGNLRANIQASEKWSADLAVPVQIAGHSGRLEAIAEGRWTEARLTVDSSRFEARADRPEAEPIVVTLAALYDFDQGELIVRPLPGGSGAVELARDGLKITGLHGGDLQVLGELGGDVASLTRSLSGWTGSTPLELEGTWSSQFSARRIGEAVQIKVQLDASDLTLASPEPGGERIALPIGLSSQAEYESKADRLARIDALATGSVATLRLSGQIDELLGRRLADLNGSLTLDDDALNWFLATHIEPEARVALRPRLLRVSGPLSGPSSAAILRGLDAEVGIDVDGLDVYGMQLGPMPLIARAQGGQVTIDRVRTSLNGGVLDLRPAIDLDDQHGVFLVLEPGSGFSEAQINAEVSRRVLSYAAPVLYGATSVRGIISGRIDDAEIPLSASGDFGPQMSGVLAFQQVTFYAGPLGRELLGLIGRANAPLLRLDQTVPWSIQGDRIHQPGMALPIGNLAAIDLAGSVGFDRSLELTVNVPIVPNAIDRVPIVGDIVGGLKISVPVTGTLGQPKIDKEAFDLGMERMGRGLKERGAAVGGGLLNMLNRVIPGAPIPVPRQPRPQPPPPGLDPEERRQRRLNPRVAPFPPPPPLPQPFP